MPNVIKNSSEKHRLLANEVNPNHMDNNCGYHMVVKIPPGWKYDENNPKEFLKFVGADFLNKNFKYIDFDHEASIDSHLGILQQKLVVGLQMKIA